MFKYVVGDVVIFNFGRQCGEVVKVNDDNTYDIEWNDGHCGGVAVFTPESDMELYSD